jgi:phosphohistidine phosphatase SixA
VQVAEKLAERGWLPDLIVSSDSTRTKQTLETMANAHPAFATADALLRGSLYTVAALDGQTRKHLQVGSNCILTCNSEEGSRRAGLPKLQS